jgi:hypothetical protein
MATPQTKKSGCGCCGCLAGCLAVILLPIIAMMVLYFTVDFGKVGDSSLVWSYRHVVRPQILEPSLKDLKPTDKAMALDIFDSYVDAYEKLPDVERKQIREELWNYVYYQSQDQPVPPEKVMHFNRFIQDQMEVLKKKYPQIPDDVLRQLPQKTM